MSDTRTTNEMDLLLAEADLDLSDYERMRARTLNTETRQKILEARVDRIEAAIGLGNSVRSGGADRNAN